MIFTTAKICLKFDSTATNTVKPYDRAYRWARTLVKRGLDSHDFIHFFIPFKSLDSLDTSLLWTTITKVTAQN